jgi:phosphatidylethanolamine/phosphatidyl-N-methylethanolamine N-methyltransferase
VQRNGSFRLPPGSGKCVCLDPFHRQTIVSAICDHVKFLGAFLRRPTVTSAIVPSSRWLAARMTQGLKLNQARVVVELGSGTGAFTQAIQPRLNPKALFLAIEINPGFAEHLARRFPRAHIVNDSAERLDEHLLRFGETAADCVLSSLPWAGFSSDLQERLLTAVLRTLRPGGQFATFAYAHAAWLPGGRQFRQLLQANFSHITTTRMVWRNLPPAFVYRCVR